MLHVPGKVFRKLAPLLPPRARRPEAALDSQKPGKCKCAQAGTARRRSQCVMPRDQLRDQIKGRRVLRNSSCCCNFRFCLGLVGRVYGELIAQRALECRAGFTALLIGR